MRIKNREKYDISSMKNRGQNVFWMKEKLLRRIYCERYVWLLDKFAKVGIIQFFGKFYNYPVFAMYDLRKVQFDVR